MWQRGGNDADSVELIFFSERAFLNAFERSQKIDKISVQVNTENGKKSQISSFTRIWSEPKTILSLWVGPIALKNVWFVVADAKFSEEDRLIGYPGLEYLSSNTGTLLEQRRHVLHGPKCSEIPYQGLSGGSAIVVVMLARLDGIVGREAEQVEPKRDRMCV